MKNFTSDFYKKIIHFFTFVENTTTNTELLIATVSNRDSRKAGLDLKLSAMNYRRK